MVNLDELRRQLRNVFREFTIFGQRRRGNLTYTVLRAFDPWNLRLRLVPPGQRERIQHSLGVTPGVNVTDQGWVFSRHQLKQSNHFLAICRK